MQIARYIANGLAATGAHYLVLYTCVEMLDFRLIGIANFVASTFGILVSFVGNKYFVFRSAQGSTNIQFMKFIIFYAIIAAIHGVFLYIWSDIKKMNYNFGFVMAVAIQFFLGYLANKFIVFSQLKKQ